MQTVARQTAIHTLSVYDYWLNFSRERQLIWQHKKSMASVLYVAIRYVNISEALFLTTQAVLFSPASRADDLTPDTLSSCGVEFKVLTASSCLAYTVLASTRTYALFNRDLRVFICVLVLGLLVPINLIYYAAKTVFSTKTLPIPHCVYSTPSPVGNALKFGAVEFQPYLPYASSEAQD
ncbi:hypothetical protein BDY19DRAFT_910730 [Irpex rosettiformis]|uniref:Uncharacterized protein n=1 Tax=Irpex rosettiformis TaxID=378272 RepID=A0ACB8TMJ8_9APHY|nr:hypothetical protein BDY19DRAFT_910730 [Irpex rosettiformis]